MVKVQLGAVRDIRRLYIGEFDCGLLLLVVVVVGIVVVIIIVVVVVDVILGGGGHLSEMV